VANILQTNTGRWRAQVRKAGVSKAKTFGSKADAQKWARQTETDIERNEFKDSKHNNILLKQLLKDYEEVLPDRVKQNSLERDKGHIALLKRSLGHLTLSQIDGPKLREFAIGRMKQYVTRGPASEKKQLSPATVKRELAMISRVLAYAQNELHYTLPHPTAVKQALALPALRNIRNGRDRRLTEDEFQALSRDKYAGRWVRAAVYTGMRRGELANIQRHHMLCAEELRSSIVTEPRAPEQHEQKPNKLLHIPETKNGHARTIPLSKEAEAAIDEILAGKRLLPNGITQAFIRACKKHDINGVVFHDLRHEATSRFFEKGLSTMEVAAITGHKSLQMLQRYTHLDPRKLLDKIS